MSVHDGSIGSLLKGLRTHALDFVIAHQDAAASPKDLIETPLFDSTTRKGVHLISVSKVTVRFPSNGAGMGR